MPRTPEVRIDWSRIAPDLPTARAIRLHPRRGETPPTASKMGGPIAWPAVEPWPTCSEHAAPLVSVLQLTRGDVPSLPWPDGTELFQLLWCPRDHDPYCAPRSSTWWRASTPGPWAVAPAPGADATASFIPGPCTVAPEEVVERPSVFELGDRSEELDEALLAEASDELARLGIPEDHALYQYHFSVAPGVKVGGFVGWIQVPDVPTCGCGTPMQHLVTIDSAEFDGAYQRWMPLEERHVWKEGYETRNAVQRAAGLMLGDMGSVYVFTCIRCPERPIASCFQCS